MIRDITIGQYYPADSVIHKLDPRVKLVGTLAYIVSLFMFKGVLVYLLSGAFLLSVVRISRVPLRYILKGLRAIVVLMLMTVCFNALLTPGLHEICSFWVFTITWEGIATAIFMLVRLVFLIIASSLMTLTTTPNHLTDGLEKGLRPLNRLHFPVHEVAMMMSIALRFIPILLEETDKIMKAQMARGADFETGGLVKKAKNLVPLLVPLFISAFRRANDLAMAMEARCYRGGNGRTKMKPLKYKKRDGAAYGVLVVYFVVMFAAKKYSPY